MLWDPFLYCINDSIQGKLETGNKVFVLTSKVSINTIYFCFLTALIVKVVVSKNIYFLFVQVIRYCSVPDHHHFE